MGTRHPNYRRVKTHRSYTVVEVASLFGIHKNTVRAWLKNGLPVIDNNRPTLILGKDLFEFLKKRRAKRKQTCKPGELYCVRCRCPKSAAEGIADYSPISDKIGNLIALCPDCDAVINRRVSNAKIREVIGNLDVQFPEDLQHIVDRANPSVNSDLR